MYLKSQVDVPYNYIQLSISRIYTTMFDMMLFFDTVLFFWHDAIFLTPCISVNPFFSRGWGQKNNDVVIFFCIIWSKTMQTFDIVSKKIHGPSVNRFDGVISWYDFDYESQIGDDTTKL